MIAAMRKSAVVLSLVCLAGCGSDDSASSNADARSVPETAPSPAPTTVTTTRSVRPSTTTTKPAPVATDTTPAPPLPVQRKPTTSKKPKIDRSKLPTTPSKVPSPSGRPGTSITVTAAELLGADPVFLVKNARGDAYRVVDGNRAAAKVYAGMTVGGRYTCRVVKEQQNAGTPEFKPAEVADCAPATN